MKRTILLCLLYIMVPGQASAVGDPGRGELKAAGCAACHGQDGNSLVGAFPKLAGQNERYLIKQMQDVQSGARSIPEMAGQLDGLTDQDLMDIAAYFSAQTVTIGRARADLVDLGERLYRAGDRDKGVTACTACHSPTGQGNAAAGFPALGGQHAEEIVKQLKAFRIAADQPAKGRTNDGETRMMRDVAARMSDLEIEAVASYISGLHP